MNKYLLAVATAVTIIGLSVLVAISPNDFATSLSKFIPAITEPFMECNGQKWERCPLGFKFECKAGQRPACYSAAEPDLSMGTSYGAAVASLPSGVNIVICHGRKWKPCPQGKFLCLKDGQAYCYLKPEPKTPAPTPTTTLPVVVPTTTAPVVSQKQIYELKPGDLYYGWKVVKVAEGKGPAFIDDFVIDSSVASRWKVIQTRPIGIKINPVPYKQFVSFATDMDNNEVIVYDTGTFSLNIDDSDMIDNWNIAIVQQ